MMRRMFSVGLAAALALCVAGTASAATTIDMILMGNSQTGTSITITPSFAGMIQAEVFLITTGDAIQVASFSLVWDTDQTFSFDESEWFGVGFGFPLPNFVPISPGVTVTDTAVSNFDAFLPPNGTFILPAGTYKFGTVLLDDKDGNGWVTTNLGFGPLTGIDGVTLIAGTNIGGSVPLGTGTINVIPEPGTASLLGLGLVGLILAGRRKRA